MTCALCNASQAVKPSLVRLKAQYRQAGEYEAMPRCVDVAGCRRRVLEDLKDEWPLEGGR